PACLLRSVSLAETPQAWMGGAPGRIFILPERRSLRQNNSIYRYFGAFGLLHQNLAARRDAELAVDDDFLARRDSFLDDYHLALLLPHRHRSHLRRRVVLDDVNELPLGRHLRGRGGDQDGPAQKAQDEPDLDESTGPKPAVAVGYRRPQIHRPPRLLPPLSPPHPAPPHPLPPSIRPP